MAFGSCLDIDHYSINNDTMGEQMARINDIVAAMRHNPCDVRFADLVKVCTHYFGEARHNKTSHLVYKTPWEGNPRVNIQKGKSGKAKVYQVVKY
ncbi:hypothetical protein [Moorena sp. SIO3A2]|uniref:hypothetical protein n=1 Tax=Moorena sp. SIO3A2 TaxID=2607841 RepID=UPI002580308F|nr:hypothetical protein [Moorena sp. SIO3A2]